MSRINEPGTTRSSRRRPALIWIGLALAGMASAAMAVVGAHGHGGGGWGCLGGSGHHGHHAFESLGDAREHSAKAAGRVLDEVDADEQQRARVMAIVEGSVDEVYGLTSEHRAHREALLEAFAGAQIDRAEIERIRGAEMELADAASRQLASALVDIAQVLSPKQREKMLEMAARHHR